MEDKNDISAVAKAYAQAYYSAHPEELVEHRKAKHRDRNRKWKADNPDKVKAYYQNNREAYDARSKAWWNANPDKTAAYRKNKRDETWQEVYKHLGRKCSCKTCTWASSLALEIDHILPVKQGRHSKAPRGGVDLRKYIINNNCWEDFQLLCANCNKLKHWNGGTCNCGDDQPDDLPNSTALWLGSIQVSDLAMAFLLTQRN